MKKTIITIILLLIFNLNVSALTLKPTGDITGIRSKELSIYLTLEKTENEKSISALDGKINYDEEIFELINYSLLINDWTEFSGLKNEKAFAFANLKFNNLLNETKNILNIKFKVKENAKYGNASISIINPSATDENGLGVDINGDSHIVKILSGENKLKNIKIEGTTINFDENLNNYNLTVENNISELKIDATLKDSNSTFINNYGPRKVKLNVGKNLIQLKVKAENDQINTYNINIIRKEKRIETSKTDKLSNNNYLSEIIINNEQFKFNKEEYEHFLTIDNKIEKVNIVVKTEDEKSTYEVIGNNVLMVGKNIFFIKVKAEDKTIREYKIVLNRKEENVKLSNNSKLKDLSINGYKINFNKEIYDYSIKIKNEKELNILYSTEDSKSNVIISGNKNLKPNSIIKITVIAEDQSITEYRVNVKKEKSENKLILIALTILSFGLLVFISSLILKNKIKKNNS